MDAGAVVLDSDEEKAKKAAAATAVGAAAAINPASGAPDPDSSALAKLKEQLQRVIDEERYEEAARLRDEIKRSANAN